ncbi:hypothetical protein [Asticcacaulis sp. W401b]|uniref:hypothetical protein n=1 Tax=Asticcacaulis sp. W401b TaxID=3388666 RepID=UPI0039706203
MTNRWICLLAASLALSACAAPPKPVTLDGKHRIPVNTPQAMSVYLKPVDPPATKAKP